MGSAATLYPKYRDGLFSTHPPTTFAIEAQNLGDERY